MSEDADEVPDHETASLVGQRFSEDDDVTTLSASLWMTMSFASEAFFVVDVGVLVTPSWKLLSRPWILLGV